MNKNKKLKNRKRYLGNPFTVAFLPVLASVGLTLGATSLSVKSGNTNEVYKSHEIKVNEPAEAGWKVTVKKDGVIVTSARKGETVVFQAVNTENKKVSNKDPSAVKINGTNYVLDNELKATVVIPFVEKMIVDLVFPEDKIQHSVTFDLNDGEAQHKSVVKVVDGERVEEQQAPEREGYKFKYWYESDENTPFDFKTFITRDHYLRAKWETGPSITPHTIYLQEEIVTDWNFTVETQHSGKAIKGETVTFNANHAPWSNLQFPYAVNLKPTGSASAGITYQLKAVEGKEWESYTTGEVTIPYETEMDATLLFKDAQNFTVSFITNGGPNEPSQIIQAGNYATRPEPTWTGHTFIDWYTTPDFVEGTEWDATKRVFENKVVYAKWSTEQFTIRFNNYNGETIETKTVDFGVIPQCSQTPTRPSEHEKSFTFTHWDSPLAPAVANATYTAQYAETTNAFTVTFDSAEGSEIPSRQVLYDYTMLDEPIPTRPGYTFDGWYNGADKWIFGDASTGTHVVGAVTLTAHWIQDKYVATFYNWDGTQLDQKTDLVYGTTPTYSGQDPTPQDPETQKWEGQWNPTLGPITRTTNYVAQFTSTKNKYKVTFDSKGGSSVLDELTIIEGNTIPESSKPDDPERNGYTFNKWWYKDSDGIEHEFIFGDAGTGTPITGNLTPYAKWTPKQYHITFKNDDDQIIETIDSNFDSMPTTPTSPTKPESTKSPHLDYTFAGWSPALVPVSGDATYVATYTSTHRQKTVTFVTDGAAEYIPPQTVNEGSHITKPTVTKQGYTLVGWFDENETEWTFDDQGKSVQTVEANTTLTAKWTINKYTVKFVNDDGETLVEPAKEWEYGQTPSCSTIPTKEPSEHKIYTFVKWDKPIIPVTGDVTYKAVFHSEYEPISVTFYTNGGTTIEPLYVRYNHELLETEVQTPTRDYCTFAGWYTDATLQTPWVPGTKVTEPLELYAKWDYPIATGLACDYSEADDAYLITKCTDSNPYLELPSTFTTTEHGTKPIYKINAKVFEGKGIQKIKLPSTIVELGNNAFCQSKLNEINLDHVLSIGTYVFYKTELVSINLSNKALAIDDNAFNDIPTLTSVKFDSSESVTTTVVFGQYVFGKCTGLTNNSVVLPANSQLRFRMFGGCSSSFTEITYEGYIGTQTTEGTWAYIYKNASYSGLTPFSESSLNTAHCKDGDWTANNKR